MTTLIELKDWIEQGGKIRHKNLVNWYYIIKKSGVFYRDDGISFSTVFLVEALSDGWEKVEYKPSKDDIGKLGCFWDDIKEEPLIDVLDKIEQGDYPFFGKLCANYKHFRPLTPEEVEKYTGYKVVKDK